MSRPTDIIATCHCGALRVGVRADLSDAMRCDCSICRRTGALWTSDTFGPEAVTVEDPGGLLRRYRFGTGVAMHHFCGRCGIHTHVSTRLDPGRFRVNLACVDALDLGSIAVETYDGRAL